VPSTALFCKLLHVLSINLQPGIQNRNLVLYFWRKDVSKYLPLARAAELAGRSSEDKELAKLAWRFLDTRGLINFGLSEDILSRRASVKSVPGTKQQRTVIVLGAGLAGLAAAQQLLKFGYKAFVLEARGFPGGRVQAARLEVRELCLRSGALSPKHEAAQIIMQACSLLVLAQAFVHM
jgi:hypothetical protein